MAILIFEQENGVPKITVKGTKGKKCLKLTEEIERTLGTVDNRKYTGEYYQDEALQKSCVTA